jgi:uncharacterized membrane protein YfcA
LLELLQQELQDVGLWGGLFCLAAVFAAAVIRGFTGFGSALLWVPVLSLLLPPLTVVPVVLVLEAGASGLMFRKVRHDADWRGIGWIWLGAGIALPAGIWLLTALPADAARTAIAFTVLAAAFLLWRGMRLAAGFASPALAGVGGIAGFMAGFVGIPGPPVFLYYLAAPVEIATARASIMVYLFGPAFAASLINLAIGNLKPHMLLIAALLFPLVALGKWVGDKAFRFADAERARKAALYLLLISAVMLLVRTHLL